MSTFPFDPDDPRLTAYALDEADEADRRAVEAMLGGAAQARAEGERTQAFARLLSAEYTRENEAYLAARPEPAAGTNVLPFPGVARSRWRRGAAPWLAVAAGLALMASLIHLSLRRSHRPAPQTVASAPPAAPAMVPTPTAAGSPPDDQPTADRVAESRAAGKPTTGANTPQDADLSTTAPDQTPMELAGAPVLERQQTTVRAREQSALPQAAEPAPASAAVPALARPAVTAKSADRVGATAGLTGADAEPAARYLTRIHASDGRFFDGVIVSTDGLILAFAPPPDDMVRHPCTVTLADQRDFTTDPEPAPLGAGWYWLRIKADGLSAAPLGADFPASGTSVSVTSVDTRTGKRTFSHPQAGESGDGERGERQRTFKGDVAFAFGPTGELLLAGPPAQQSQSYDRARASGPSAKSVSVRPFTPAEQEIIQRAISGTKAPR